MNRFFVRPLIAFSSWLLIAVVAASWPGPGGLAAQEEDSTSVSAPDTQAESVDAGQPASPLRAHRLPPGAEVDLDGQLDEALPSPSVTSPSRSP